MKKLLLLIALLMVFNNAMAQSDGMSYQAVILNPNVQELPGENITGNILPNKALSVRFTISSSINSIEYQETHATSTDVYGMINLMIGKGVPSIGVFSEIYWDGSKKDLKVEINLDGTFKNLSNQELTYIPYAYHRDILASGNMIITGLTNLKNDLDVTGITTLNNAVFVNNGSATNLSGELNVQGKTTLGDALFVENNNPTNLNGALTVNGLTNLNNTLNVNNESPVNLTGDLNIGGGLVLESFLTVKGKTTLNNDLTVTNKKPTILTGTISVDGETILNNSLNVKNGSETNLTGIVNVEGKSYLNNTLNVKGNTVLNSSLVVNNSSETNLTGVLHVEGISQFNNTLNVNNGSKTNLSGELNVEAQTNLNNSLNVAGITNLNNALNVTDGSTTNLSGALNVSGLFSLGNDLTVNGTTNLNSGLLVNNGSPTNLTGTLNVNELTNLNNTLTVAGATLLNNTLEVANNNKTNLTGELNVEGKTVLNDKLTVNGPTLLNNYLVVGPSKPAILMGDLRVDGYTDLNSVLRVNNKSATYLSGILTVDGSTILNNSLTINNGALTKLSGSLIVDGATELNNDLNVNNGSNSNFTGNLNVEGAFSVKGGSSFEGETKLQKLIVSGIGGVQGDHIALFENTAGGDGDGIAIKINQEITTDENNFITFYRNDQVAGRVEGYHHNLGSTPVIIDNIIKPFFGSAKTLMTDVLGFQPPFSIDFGALPSITGGSWPSVNSGSFPNFNKGSFPSFNSGSLPSLTPWDTGSLPSMSGGSLPSMSGGSLPSINLSSASWPTLTGGRLPKVTFNGDVKDFITPWNWFNPDFTLIPKNQNDLNNLNSNPIFQVFSEAYENDWKTLLNLGIGDIAAKVIVMELEAVMKSEGVTFGSKGADYAEWLPRVNEKEDLEFGQIVGVKGGEISLDTNQADQILVISSKPIILGNMPTEGKENLFEKVAFMGQVPTWVSGDVQIGDYILASGKNNGVGVAISKKDIKISDVKRIVGTAWSKSNNSILSLINVSVGLKTNEWIDILEQQENRLNTLEAKMDKLENLIEKGDTI